MSIYNKDGSIKKRHQSASYTDSFTGINFTVYQVADQRFNRGVSGAWVFIVLYSILIITTLIGFAFSFSVYPIQNILALLICAVTLLIGIITFIGRLKHGYIAIIWGIFLEGIVIILSAIAVLSSYNYLFVYEEEPRGWLRDFHINNRALINDIEKNNISISLSGRSVKLTKENIYNLSILGYACCNYADDKKTIPLPCPDRDNCTSTTRVYSFFFNTSSGDTVYDVDASAIYQYYRPQHRWEVMNKRDISFNSVKSSLTVEEMTYEPPKVDDSYKPQTGEGILVLSDIGLNDEHLANMIAVGQIPRNVVSLDISSNEINDIISLLLLTSLEYLRLEGNPVTQDNEKMATLKNALPNCDIHS